MTVAASKLDTEKFRKVHVMMTGGATPGERSAAKARAESMAAKAGMSLEKAVSELDGQSAPSKPRNLFDDLMADPEWRASHDAWTAKRESEDEALREKALAEYGSEDAVWSENERERLLRETLEPLADWGRYANFGASPGGLYIKGYAGWDHGRPTFALVEALMRAYPFAPDLAGQWAEYQEWERLYTYRHAFMTHYDFPVHVRARMDALRFHLDTLSDPTFEGFAARLEWLKLRTEQDMSSDVHDDLSMIATMRVDLAMLKATHAPKGSPSGGGPSSEAPKGYPQSGHPLPRTTAEKRAAILSMLDSEPGLSDREIARRLGVSPQTVNTWRRKR